MRCENCNYCQYPRTSDDNGGACKCRAMKRKTIDVMVSLGETPEWCPLKEREREQYIKHYRDFRKELDKMCVPLIIGEMKRIEPIKADGKIVGMVGGFTDYIDCVYVKPEYRRRGLARQAVLKFVEGNLDYGIRLHIINNNNVAYDFWSKIFELKKIATNAVDTLYEIVKIKE